VRRYSLDPRLEPGTDERRALGLGIQMMRRPHYQHEPPLTRVHIDLVHLDRDLVLGLRDTSTQVLVKEEGMASCAICSTVFGVFPVEPPTPVLSNVTTRRPGASASISAGCQPSRFPRKC
jgi:hypothetical protein